MVTDESQGKEVEAVTVPLSQLTGVSCDRVTTREQIKASWAKSSVVGVGFAVAITVLFFFKTDAGIGFILPVFLFALLSGQLMALLFSFLPNIFKIKRSLFQMNLWDGQGRSFLVGVSAEEKDRALSILEHVGLREASTQELANVDVRNCPQCGAAYRLSDYAPDAFDIYCSACKARLPQETRQN